MMEQLNDNFQPSIPDGLARLFTILLCVIHENKNSKEKRLNREEKQPNHRFDVLRTKKQSETSIFLRV